MWARLLYEASHRMCTSRSLVRDMSSSCIMRWLGKTAVVTGAGGAIGSLACKKLALLGMNVVAVDLQKSKAMEQLEAELQNAAGRLYFESCNITDDKSVADLFCKVDEMYQGASVCLCCAGIALPGSIMSGEYKNWRSQMDVNLMGMTLCSREAISSMSRTGKEEGHIIHIGSVSGHRVSEKEDLHFYQVTKHAVSTLGEALRLEMAVHGCPFKITQICPGYVDTGLWDTMYKGQEGSEQKVKDIKPSSTDKLLDADDVVNVVLFCIATPSHVVINDIIMRTMGTTL
ncbi:dehydrogenase/reductase SDR family member 11-like [Periplaneta americana]|uniref:dehydrogenase/reductase SDR family member 11-like n=1 Tax=Periplaneta americana TaxID=6978 RepID=UPI0037E7B72B